MNPIRRLSVIVFAATALCTMTALLSVPRDSAASPGERAWWVVGISALTGVGVALLVAVAARAELEAERRRSGARAEALLRPITDAVLVTDASDNLALCNQAALRALGLDASATHRQPIERLIPDPPFLKRIAEMREHGGESTPRRFEHRMTHLGRDMLVDVALSPMPEPRGKWWGGSWGKWWGGGEAGGVVAVLRDITHEREVAEAKSDFAAGISHELRTPLSSIKAYMEMLVDGEAGDEPTRSEFYRIVQSETNRLSRLIDNILSISRIESGFVPEPRETLCLVKVALEAADMMQPRARARRVHLEARRLDGGCQAPADEALILEAMLNLIGNAVEYTPAGGRVVVEPFVDAAGHSVGVRVSDTGPGVEADVLPRLFEKFYRATELRQTTKGAGLGLTLVKRVVETVHGGTLLVSSRAGAGSTFGFSIPAHREPAPPRLRVHTTEGSYA